MRNTTLGALELLQHGGWSIWGNLSYSADRAEAILRDGADSTEKLVKIYAPIIVTERHVEAWRRAAHIIKKVSSIASCEERARMVQLAIEHIEILVGKCVESTREYDFLQATETKDSSSSIMELLLAAVDHPSWLRREKAAELIFWLLSTHPSYIPILGPRAFGTDSTNLPDVLCGVLDHLSTTDPSRFWGQLAPSLDIEYIQSNCKHMVRLRVLKRISERAVRRGSESAKLIAEAVSGILSQSANGVDNAAAGNVACPDWAVVCDSEWQELSALGLMTQEFVEKAKKILHEVCSPLSIETATELESLVARGGGDPQYHPSSRWRAKVRYALQVALLPHACDSSLDDIDRIFGVCNPSPMNRLRVLGFKSPSRTWLNSLRKTDGIGIGPAVGDDFYLDFFERVWGGNRYRRVRMTAFFYSAHEVPHPPSQAAEFLSTELHGSLAASTQWACRRVGWRPVFFGGFTPAVPSVRLMDMTNATSNDITRANWRIGRARGAGPASEGCFLAIKRAALRLHPGVKMAWLCEIDENRAIISR